VARVFEGLLKEQVRGDGQIAGMLTAYKGKPAFFFQKSPSDGDVGWEKPCYPRMEYNIDNRSDPERKVSGTMSVNIWCTSESGAMPEDVEKRLVELIDGTFYTTADRTTRAAAWSRSDAFAFETSSNSGGNTAPEVFGVTVMFDLMEFPEQLTTDPDPIQSLNEWTRAYFPDITVINLDEPPPVWKPADNNPAIYWRFEGTAANDRQTYSVNWYTGQFAAHVIARSVTERNRWTKAIAERIQLDGEVILTDGSPMFAKQIVVRHSADFLREGQLLLTGNYGVLAARRRERTQCPLNRAVLSEFQ
jgi:hypothetical protein